MNFEMFATKKLLSEYVEQYLEQIMRIQKSRERGTNEVESIPTKFRHLADIIEAHWVVSCGMDHDEVFRRLDSNRRVVEMLNDSLNQKPYSERELNHIYLDFKVDKTAYEDIAIKRLLFSIYGTEDVEQITKMFEKEKEYLWGKSSIYMPFIFLLNDEFESKQDVIEYINRTYEDWINKRFNCGGYAFEIVDWVCPIGRSNDDTVSRLLDNPSVRLLGDTLLEDDEYLVVLDADNYHFVKCKDGKFSEKMRYASYLSI